MRRRYMETKQFLSPVMDSTELYAYSTGLERTYMSAISYMTGLYPAGGPPQLFDN